MDELTTCAKCGEPIGVYEPSVVVHELHAQHGDPQAASAEDQAGAVHHYHLDCRFDVSVAGEDRHAA